MSALLELETLESYKFQSYINITFIDSLDKGIRGLFVFKFFSQNSIELGIFDCRYEFIFDRHKYLHAPSFLKRVFKLLMRSELTNNMNQ